MSKSLDKKFNFKLIKMDYKKGTKLPTVTPSDFVKIRVDLGLSQPKFAKALGINLRTVQYIEAGKVFKRVNQLAAILVYLHRT